MKDRNNNEVVAGDWVWYSLADDGDEERIFQVMEAEYTTNNTNAVLVMDKRKLPFVIPSWGIEKLPTDEKEREQFIVLRMLEL